MSEVIIPNSIVAPIPLPDVNVTIRAGVMGDIPFIDRLQKMHAKMVGWMPTKQLEGKIEAGHVLVAEAMRNDECGMRNENAESSHSAFRIHRSALGYLIGTDQYFKRDDVGVIYQMNVAPGKQRGLIGASLLKAQFERSAYGCKLYCCWCAQDIAANKFWEAMGFVPLAYRAGSEKKGPKGSARVHIFWQKRIRQGDATTPWWYPSKTNSGAIRADRIVLPIVAGTHWSDAKPLVLPAEVSPKKIQSAKAETKKKSVEKPTAIRRNGLFHDIPKQGEALPEKKVAKEPKVKTERVKTKCDPRLVAAARELRDRWLEEVNAGECATSATCLATAGKYDVAREIADERRAMPMLAA